MSASKAPPGASANAQPERMGDGAAIAAASREAEASRSLTNGHDDGEQLEKPPGNCLTQWRGMFRASQLIGLALGLGAFIVVMPCELAEEHPKANDMLAVALLVACFWAFEVFPLEVTSLLPMVLIPFAEIATSSKVAASYWNWIQMLFLGAFIVDIGIKHTGLHKRAALKILLSVGVTRAWAVLAAFMFIAWGMSMWCSNTATTCMLVPYATFLLDTALGEQDGTRTTDPKKLAFSRGVFLAIAYAATSGGIATSIGTAPNGVLLGQPLLDGNVSSAQWMAFAFPVSCLLFVTVFAVVYFVFARGVQLGLDEKVLREQYESLGGMDRDETVVLAIQILQIVGWMIRPEVINGLLGIESVNDGSIACAAAVWLFFIPSCRRTGSAILSWKAAERGLPWGIFLMMGGGFALAKGFETSGLTVWIGSELSAVGDLHPLGLTYLIVLCVAVTTELTSNTATASIILPVLSSVSVETLLHPMALLAPATCACSCAFMLPAATPPNLVVLATGRVSISDFLRPGALINLIAILLGSPLMYLMATVVFEIDGPFPQYACQSDSGCQWVQGQACVTQGSLAAGLCRTQDGAFLNTTTGMPA